VEKIPIRRLDLPQKEPKLSVNFSIRRIEELLNGKEMNQELHRHDFFFILILKNGDGYHEIDFTPYEACDHSITFIRPGQVHQLTLKTESTGYLIQFKTDFFYSHDKASQQLLRQASSQIFRKFEPDKFKTFEAILSYFFKEYIEKQEGYQEVIKLSLSIFFIELIRNRQNKKASLSAISLYSQEQVEKFLELLETHISKHKQVSEYADMLNLSSYQLNAITKTSLNKTPSELINEYIVLESKRHLLATSRQVNQIAYYMGYEDVSYFIRFFKKHTGHSPEAFRNNFK
jgi:AraC family transcriptional regulator, transcriptional activator of pobA